MTKIVGFLVNKSSLAELSIHDESDKLSLMLSFLEVIYALSSTAFPPSMPAGKRPHYGHHHRYALVGQTRQSEQMNRSRAKSTFRFIGVRKQHPSKARHRRCNQHSYPSAPLSLLGLVVVLIVIRKGRSP